MHRLIAPIAAALALHGALLAGYLAGFGGDPGALVCLGRERLGQAPYQAIHVAFERNGYDGQFYYSLAQSPWRRHAADLDHAVCRQVRILYPAISWLISGGDALRLLWVMPLVNWLAIGALAGLGAELAWRYGLSPWWGAVLPIAVNAGMPLLRDLTDILSTLGVLLLVAAWLLRWPSWALGLGALAALLSREQNVIIVLLVLLVALASRRTAEQEEPARSWQRSAAALAAALGVWGVWLCVLHAVYGQWPVMPANRNLAPPLEGFLYRWSHLADGSRSSSLLHLTCMSLLLVQIGLTLYLLVKGPRERLAALVALAGTALCLVGGMALYGDKWSYTRVFAWLPLGLWIACVQVRWRWPLVVLSVPLVLPLAVVYRVWFPGA